MVGDLVEVEWVGMACCLVDSVVETGLEVGRVEIVDGLVVVT